ncbi:hypothetical protein L596_001300 [Steinernema carpocapsae]|uniref:Uncharacterized protein n=1 Tax=Steinernema carpocapsae TaxID=34508 RepID=A0A4U8UL61_STECR|nr:hypothetical protein L596_001300 [Steinernema carpocapsae]
MADENAVSSTTTSLPTANTRCKSEPPSVLRALLESDSDEEGVSKSEPCYSCRVSPESNHCSNISDPNSPVNCSVRQPAVGSPATPSPSPLNGPEQSQNDFPNTPTSDQENSPKKNRRVENSTSAEAVILATSSTKRTLLSASIATTAICFMSFPAVD